MNVSGGRCVTGSRGRPGFDARSVFATGVQIEVADTTPDDHFTAGPHCGVPTSGLRHVRATSSRPIIYALSRCDIKVRLGTNGICFGVSCPTGIQRTWNQDQRGGRKRLCGIIQASRCVSSQAPFLRNVHRLANGTKPPFQSQAHSGCTASSDRHPSKYEFV